MSGGIASRKPLPGYLAASPTEHIDLGAVRILRKGQEIGRTEIPEKTDRLTEDYCSLGQEVAYYETLRKLPRAEYERFFRAMQDVVYDPLILATFESERGFTDSLLRSTAAETAVPLAPALFPGLGRSVHAGEAKLHFRTTVGGASFVISFDFADDGRLPARINAVIGSDDCPSDSRRPCQPARTRSCPLSLS